MAKPSLDDPREPEIRRRDTLLWLPVLAGPFAWALHEQASYMLTPTACDVGHKLILHLVTLVALLIALAGAALAWSRWKAAPEGSTETGDPEETRVRFMALAGLGLCATFALIILAAEIPNLVLKVCD
ncbi:MAG TPA: hypothetical protein VGG03_10360 [Thermoanaerobaculia bacterium]|jgi:hypothetical protein